MKRTTFATAGIAALAFATLAAPAPAEAQYRQKITNDAAKCAAGSFASPSKCAGRAVAASSGRADGTEPSATGRAYIAVASTAGRSGRVRPRASDHPAATSVHRAPHSPHRRVRSAAGRRHERDDDAGLLRDSGGDERRGAQVFLQRGCARTTRHAAQACDPPGSIPLRARARDLFGRVVRASG